VPVLAAVQVLAQEDVDGKRALVLERDHELLGDPAAVVVDGELSALARCGDAVGSADRDRVDRRDARRCVEQASLAEHRERAVGFTLEQSHGTGGQPSGIAPVARDLEALRDARRRLRDDSERCVAHGRGVGVVEPRADRIVDEHRAHGARAVAGEVDTRLAVDDIEWSELARRCSWCRAALAADEVGRGHLCELAAPVGEPAVDEAGRGCVEHDAALVADRERAAEVGDDARGRGGQRVGHVPAQRRGRVPPVQPGSPGRRPGHLEDHLRGRGLRRLVALFARLGGRDDGGPYAQGAERERAVIEHDDLIGGYAGRQLDLDGLRVRILRLDADVLPDQRAIAKQCHVVARGCARRPRLRCVWPGARGERHGAGDPACG